MGKMLIINADPAHIEAQVIAERLQEYSLAAVYFLRVPGAEEAASVLAGRNNLKAMALPGCTGIEWKDLDDKDASTLDHFIDTGTGDINLIRLPFESGLYQLRAELAAALDEIAVRHKKETVAIISHRALSVIMILHLLHMDNSHYSQIAQDKGAVNLFEVRMGLPSALYINDICHLEGVSL